MLKPTRWFEIVVSYTILTMLVVYSVPSDSIFFAVRYLFSFVFLAFVPGYCLVNLLFSRGNQLELVEKIVLSVALSFGVTGLVGLFLGLSPVGIDFTSISLSLAVIVLVLAIAAFLVKRRELREIEA
jgi:uncharacterized membrane protein